MTIATYVPTLSTDGWVSSPSLMGDYLLSHFFVSDYSQTELYNGQVASLPYLIALYQNNISGLLIGVQDTLSVYLSRYFNNVVVEANSVPNTTNSSSIGFSIFVGYTGTDGIQYTLTNIIETVNSKISNIINQGNG